MFGSLVICCAFFLSLGIADGTRAAEPVVNSGVVEAPVGEVWEALTTSRGITTWMVPAGEVELAIGGKYRTSYTKDSDLKGPDVIENTILAYDPERMISFRNTRAPEGFPFFEAMQRVWTVVYLDPVDENRTRVTFKMLGFGTDPDSVKMREFFVHGNAMTLGSLVKRFTKELGRRPSTSPMFRSS
jgi:uncharacterized protein YndB with AHSA1/START domain